MAISGGKYLIGENGDYATLSAAINDIGASINTDMTFMVISPFTDPGMAAPKDIAFGNPNLTLKITSPIDMKGKPICAFQISLTGDRQGYFSINTTGVKTGKIIYEHLYMKNIDQPASAPSYQLYFTAASPYTQQEVQVHDCVFDGGGYNNTFGIRAAGDHGNKIWNCVFMDMPATNSYGIRCYGKGLASNDPSRIDNCIFYNIDHGIHYNANEYYTNNCVGFGGGNPFNDAVGINADTKSKSNGNVSDYSSIVWDEPRSRLDPDVGDQFVSLDPTNKDFMVPVGGSYLETFGAEPGIQENDADVEGTAKPNSSLAFCSGVVGRREKLKEHWSSVRKFTIDGSKIKVSTSSIQFCLTQIAPGMTEVFKSAKADGGDLRITTDRWGWEKLPIEVAQWDPDNEKCMVWFKPAAVVAGEDYDFYLWFGNANAAEVPLNHDYGQWAVWEDCNLVLHCLEDPVNDGFVKDSSSKMHYGVFKNAVAATYEDGLPDGRSIGKSYRMRESASGTAYVDLPAGDYLNGDTYAQMSAWIRPTGASNHPILDIGQQTTGRRWQYYLIATSQQSVIYAPDAASQSSGADSSAMTSGQIYMVAGRVDLVSVTKSIRWFQNGQFTEQDTLANATGAFTDVDSAYARFGSNEGHTGYFESNLQEAWIHNTDRSDGYQETFYENLENGASFFKTPTVVSQKGCRDILFETEEGEVHLSATDFYITYEPSLYDKVVMNLNAVWDSVALDQEWGLPRREAIESELRHLQKLVGKYGTLTIGPDYEQTYDKMTLSGVTVEVADNNAAIVYTMTFNPDESFRVSRSVVFNGQRIDAQDFFVAYTRSDRTQFKEVFRAAPLRIESGPNLTRIRIEGMIAITGDAETALGVRQRTEQFLKDWATLRQGTEGTLEIDGVEVGTAHLVNVEPSDLSIPGRLGVSMEFATDYGS